MNLGRGDFSATEDDPRLLSLGLTVATTPHSVADGLVLRVTAPGRDPVTVTCDADGAVESDTVEAALTAAGQDAAIGASVLGAWTVQATADDNPGLVLDAIDNIALVVGYSFTPRG